MEPQNRVVVVVEYATNQIISVIGPLTKSAADKLAESMTPSSTRDAYVEFLTSPSIFKNKA